MNNLSHIGIIVVLYHPSQKETERAQRWQDDYPTVLVDNTRENRGIAAAQNIGIRQLINKVNFILLLDQDSFISPSELERLHRSFLDLSNNGVRVAAVSPRPYNKFSRQPYPYSTNYLATYNSCMTEVYDLMGSGMLIATEILRQVGEMDESLFIDGVDSEWCWRARREGYRLFVNEDIHMEHMLGIANRRLGGRTISVTPPSRMFYMYRNYLRLCRRDYVPTRWRWKNGFKYAIKAIYYTIAGPHRTEYLRQITRGILAGICPD